MILVKFFHLGKIIVVVYFSQCPKMAAQWSFIITQIISSRHQEYYQIWRIFWESHIWEKVKKGLGKKFSSIHHVESTYSHTKKFSSIRFPARKGYANTWFDYSAMYKCFIYVKKHSRSTKVLSLRVQAVLGCTVYLCLLV